MTMAEYLRSIRTQSQREVNTRSAVHDSHNLTTSEQRAILQTLKGARS